MARSGRRVDHPERKNKATAKWIKFKSVFSSRYANCILHSVHWLVLLLFGLHRRTFYQQKYSCEQITAKWTCNLKYKRF